MKHAGPFDAADLAELDARLLSLADRVVPMRDIYKGDTGPRVIGLRHDVDDNPGSFQTALALAEWEFERGYSSTYYLLHTAAYWDEALLYADRFEELGHEVGIHVNALADALRHGSDPARVLARALHELRATGVRVVGSAAHGDPLCRDTDGHVVFANDEMFTESPRPTLGDPDRILTGKKHRLMLAPMSREVFGLEYDAPWLERGNYLSDSGRRWSQSFDGVVDDFGKGQLHILMHPDWWVEAFAGVTA